MLPSLLMHLQLFVELSHSSSLVLLSPAGSLLSWRAAESSRAAASPAFMAGQVMEPAMLDYMVCQVWFVIQVQLVAKFVACRMAGCLHVHAAEYQSVHVLLLACFTVV